MSFETHPPIPEFAHGWTPARKALLLDLLLQKGNVGAAAIHLPTQPRCRRGVLPRAVRTTATIGTIRPGQPIH